MADIAELGFKADDSDLRGAKASLEALVPAATRAEEAAEKLGATTAAAGSKVDAAAAGMVSAFSKINSAASGASVNLAEGYDILTGKMNKNFLAIGQNLQKFNVDLGNGSKAHNAYKLSATDNLNVMRQFADIGTTAAMGMSPFMILIQQGPQLLDVFQQAAARTGASIRTLIMTALAPFLPLIIGIGVALTTVAATFGLATRQMNKDNGDLVKSLGLTDKQMQKLKDSGTETSITLSDSFKGFFVTLGQYLGDTDMFKALKKAWSDALDFVMKYGIKAIQFLVGSFSGAYEAIKAIWSMLPGAIGDAILTGVNKTIAAVNWLVNKVVDGVNALGGKLDHVNLGGIDNPFSGKLAAAQQAGAKAFAKGYDDGVAAINRFGVAWEKNSRKIAAARIMKAAGHAEKTPKGPKTDAEKFSDIVTGAQNDIAALNAQASAIGKTALETATLEEKTKLLGQAKSKDITLTASMIAKINELAHAYGVAKVAADNAKALNEIVTGGEASIVRLKGQADMIGLTGRALDYQTKMTELLTEAASKKLPVDEKTLAIFKDIANRYADEASRNNALKYYTDARNAALENLDTLMAERDAIGLNAEATAAATFHQKLLNDEKYRGISYTPQEISDLEALAAKQYQVQQQIDNTRDALNFARDGVRGFIGDLRSGLDQGKGFFQSFTSAVMGLLNKLTDKLTDLALNTALGGGGQTSGGFLGSLLKIGKSALGLAAGGGGSLAGDYSFKGVGAIGSIDTSGFGFAKGGAFDSGGIVNSPTMFRHAGGLGVMGEAGSEAVMPLTRGPDGSLGVQMYGGAGGGGNSNVHVTIAADEGAMFVPRVTKIASDQATAVTQEGFRQYDENLPDRMAQINDDPRFR